MTKTWQTLFFIAMILGGLLQLRGSSDRALREITRPDAMVLAHEQLYILEGLTIHGYTLSSMTYLGSFGRVGEGPGELQPVPSVNAYMMPHREGIMLVGMNKAIVFGPRGVYIREFKIPPFTNYLHVLDENRFLTLSLQTDTGGQAKLEVGVKDKDFQTIKTIYTQKMSASVGQINLTLDGLFMGVGPNWFALDRSKEGFMVGIYNLDGISRQTIFLPMPPVPFDKNWEKQRLDTIRENREVKAVGWQKFSSVVKFIHDDHVPLIQDLLVDGEDIYIRIKDDQLGRACFLVFNEEGGLLRRVAAPKPLETDFSNALFGRPLRLYQFHQGQYFFLKEEVESGLWCLLESTPQICEG